VTEQCDFVVADLDGQIVRFGSCPATMVTAQAAAGEQAIQGRGDPLLHYVWDGHVRDFTAAQVQRRSARPGPWCLWSMVEMDWIDQRAPGVALAEAKAATWNAIKAARDAAISAQLSTEFGNFDAGPCSRAAMVEALALGGWAGEDTINWTTADNQSVALTPAQLSAVARLLAQRTQACHDQARQLRQQIDAATTTAELAAITWPQAP
jgi:hypothetical protein